MLWIFFCHSLSSTWPNRLFWTTNNTNVCVSDFGAGSAVNIITAYQPVQQNVIKAGMAVRVHSTNRESWTSKCLWELWEADDIMTSCCEHAVPVQRGATWEDVANGRGQQQFHFNVPTLSTWRMIVLASCVISVSLQTDFQTHRRSVGRCVFAHFPTCHNDKNTVDTECLTIRLQEKNY